MSDDNVVALIKDLTAKLSAVAQEFSGRADQVDAGQEPAGEGGSAPAITLLDRARTQIEHRRLRRRFLPEELFHEPAWDMLLALYVADQDGAVMNVKTLVSCADAPVTTSQRWIEHLAKLRLVTRVVDPIDRRRIEVSLSPEGLKAMEVYLAALD